MAWSVSTSDGVALDAEELSSVVAAQHARLVQGWRGFTVDMWDCGSRNERWSVHETVRHVADGMERGAAAADGDNDLEALEQFDPRSTPDIWLEASSEESPAATIERFDVAAHRFRDGELRAPPEQVGEPPAALCERHRHLVHEGGWNLGIDREQRITRIKPDRTVWYTDSGPPRTTRHRSRRGTRTTRSPPAAAREHVPA